MAVARLYRELTTLRTILTVGVIAAVAIGLLWASANVSWLQGVPELNAVVRELGALLFATATIAVLWDLVARRAFLSELLAAAKVAEDVRAAGLTAVSPTFHRGIEWSDLFRTVRHLDIFFAYGRTWRASNNAHLGAVAKREGSRVRVVLPDPDEGISMSRLANRFSMTDGEVKRLIEQAAADFQTIFSSGKADYSLWYVPVDPVFSFYRFDDRAVLALYTHQRQRGQVPTFVFEQGGTLYDFVRSEFEAFVTGGMARRVYPS